MSSVIWPIVALVFATAGLFAARRGEKPTQIVNALAWLALGGGFVSLQLSASAPLAAAAGVAALAGCAHFRPIPNDATRRLRAASLAAVIPVSVAVVALVCIMDRSSEWGGRIVVYTAAWAALVAGLSNIAAAAGSTRNGLSISTALAGVGVAIGMAIAGTGRSSLPEAFYGFPLRAGDEPLQWILDPVPGFESGLRLAVAVPVDTFLYLVGAVGVFSLTAAVLLAIGKRKAAGFAFGAVPLVSIAAFGSLSSIVAGLGTPSPDPYSDEVKRRLLSRGQERVVDTGRFLSDVDLTVQFADISPEFFGFVAAGLLGLIGLISALRDVDEGDAAVDFAFARDYMLRGVAFLWMSWFILAVAHFGFLGAPGMASPAEWTFLAGVLASSGLLLAGWRHDENAVTAAAAKFGPGLALLLWFALAGLAWRFGGLPGLSLGIW